MLDTILNLNINDTTLSVSTVLMLIGIAFILGFMISLTYMKTSKNYHSENFAVTLMLLPVLMSTIILLIGNNVAGAFSLAGIFSVIRFRSAPGSSKDIVYILFCVGSGLACGIQIPIYGVMFTIIVCTAVIILDKVDYGKRNSKNMQLTILVPEDLNNEHVFDDVLKRYTRQFRLSRMRTKDFGSVYELTFQLTILNNSEKHEMIDELRCRNGNLNISLSMLEYSDEF
ncbi:DUF4956 domain-containing protein [Breznakia pachnodae]|uniref:DUF4956 domain-containing protein n=1 Tax=Breznakia pachnodae TaxID=265178 RepID=A0ABU0DYN9_9FIRM|nr:DUF4956 domain-containing protein [Breznakia pachnodae]MDQ0359655.1 hypothetical protein [Breznakia pachnodae]